MTLFDKLARLDKKRQRLALYEERARRLWFAPAMRQRFLKRFSARWHEVTEQRARVIARINADPALREEKKRLDRAAHLAAAERPVPPATPLSTHQDLTKDAALVVKLKHAERDARSAYQDAVWYYKSGEWKAYKIPVEDITAVMDHLKTEMMKAYRERAAQQDKLEKVLATRKTGDPTHILERERLLRQAEIEGALALSGTRRSPPNAFEQWLRERVPDKKKLQHSRSRQKLHGL